MKNTSPRKEITIDDLALMVAKGFDDISGKITHMDTKIDTMDQRIDTLDQRIDTMDQRIDERLGRIEATLENLKANLNKKVDKVDHNTLTYRVEKLEKKFA